MFKTLSAVALSLAALSEPALADTPYPNKAIRLVVPFAPGGSSDIMARLLGQQLSTELGQSVIVENRPGAGGNIGGDYVSKAAPDGYTLVIAAAGPTVINPSLYAKMPYNPAKDLAPITMIVNEYNMMVINPKIPAKTLQEFIAYAKTQPGKINFGSPGNGSPAHLGGELLNQMAGLKMQHIPYKGTGPAATDLIGGQISMMIDNMPALLPYVQSGTLRALAVAGDKRASAAPNVPTFAEAGLKDYKLTAWKGLMAPVGTPPEIINKLHDTVVKVLAKPDFRKRLVDLGADPVGNTPQEFAAQIKSETTWWASLVKSTGTRID
jgi:tripartite-type tricarboxylate transporter receptor subunit TctC